MMQCLEPHTKIDSCLKRWCLSRLLKMPKKILQWNPREVNTLEVNSRLKSTPHGGPDFFLLCLSDFISLKVKHPRADSRLKSTPHGQRKEIARQRKGRIKDGRAVFFRFQILLSHNNNHLTAPYGLAAASDVVRKAHAARQ